MASTLNGRIARLEAAMVPDSDFCRGCGLRHVQPLTIALLRSVLFGLGYHVCIDVSPL